MIHSTVHGEVFILDNMNIYEDIGKRTGGDVYIGAVSYTHLGRGKSKKQAEQQAAEEMMERYINVL